MLPLLATPGQLRRFLLVSAQSAIGTQMGYVALLLLAHDQLDSAWAVGAVLVANLLPLVVLGPYAGQLADRRSRRSICIAADAIRAVAFLGLAFSGSFALTLLLTLAAGAGTALYRPASRSAIPTLAPDDVDGAAGALVTITTAATLVGPAIAAGVLLVAPVEALAAANATTFVVSAIVLAGLTLDGIKPADKPWVPMTLDEALAEERFRRRAIREGFVVARRVPRLPLVILTSAGATFALGFGNVGEPLLATGPLGGSDAAFPLIVAVFGVGATLGAAAGTASVRRLILGIVAGALVMAAVAVSPTLPVALVCFALGGFVDGLTISCDQRLVTVMTPPEILGRAFGLKDSLDAAAILAAFVVSSGIAAAAGPRWVFGASALCAGVVGLVAAGAAARQQPRAVVAEPQATTAV